MFQALVSLLKDKDEPVRATASLALAPAYEPPPPGAPRRRSPEGGWEKWLDEITAKEHRTLTATSGLTSTFQSTLKAAEEGSLPAQSAVAMMYANGKGVQQNYAEAGKWWMKAASGGDLAAARHAWNLYSNGEGEARNMQAANQMAPRLASRFEPRVRIEPRRPLKPRSNDIVSTCRC
jgi:hypothetical protein